jgi:hypothetical protein
MWNNGGNGNFTSPIGQEGVVKSTTIAEVKAHGSTKDSPLFHVMNKIMSKFDELEERIFGAPIVTLPHAAHTGESASAFSQPQYERPFHYYLDQHGRFVYDNQSELASLAPETDRANSRGVSTKLPVERPYYFDQHGRVVLKSQSKLVSSVPKTDRANLGGASTIPPSKTLSYCYFDQDGKLIFRKKPKLVSSVPEIDRTNSGGVSTILPTATYIPNSVCTSQTDDRTVAPHASLPHIMVLPNSPKSLCMTPMLETSCDASQTDSQKFINRFWKTKVAKLDMQATHDGDAYPSPCNKTLSMAETLEINNPAILIRPEQADSTFGKNVIIGEPRESRKGKKELDDEVVLEKSNDNRESQDHYQIFWAQEASPNSHGQAEISH